MTEFPRLTFEGYELLFKINDALDDAQIEADDLADGLDEALGRIGVGCQSCGRQVDTRFGWCYQCFMADLDVLREES
jgi:hypothetical protein